MEDEIPLLKEASQGSDAGVLQEVTLVPLEAQTVPSSNNENAPDFLPSVTESVSVETETNQNAGNFILHSTSPAAKDKKDTDSTKSQSTSPSTEPNQDVSQSDLSTTETNQDVGPLTLSAILSNQDVGPSISSSILSSQDADPWTSSAILSNQDAGQSVSSTTETKRTFELILSAPEIYRNTTQEGASTLDDGPPTESDPLLPPDPPDYHDIIPLFDDGSNILPPPPSIFKSLFCCFFVAYHLYYARKIRNSRYILILLVAFLALPISALYMGFKYYFSCSVSPHTPLLLCIMGGVGLMFNILRIFTIISRRFENIGLCEPPRILAESSALSILCLFIVELITFFRNTPVFDDPEDPRYCPELVHEYIFYMNFLVPAIGITALLIHLPMKPTNNMQRILEEAAERDTLRQQQNMENIEDDPSLPQVYTAWVKPRRRRRRSRLNAENSEANDPRLGLNEGTGDQDSRSRHNEECIEIPAPSSEETIVGETARAEDMRVRWWDDASAVSVDTRSDSWDGEGSLGGPIGGQVWDEEGAVGGQLFLEEYDILRAVDSHWGPEEGAVGGDIREDAEWGGMRTLLWDEGVGLDTPPRNRSSTFTIHRGEESPTRGFPGPSRWDEKGVGLRFQRLEESSKYGARPKTRETEEGGVRSKRNKRYQDDVNPLHTENTETEVGALLNEGRVESDALGSKWHEYGARPKIKANAECVPKIKSKEGTGNDAKYKSKRSTIDNVRPRQNESIEAADIILRNKEGAKTDAFGHQCTIGNAGGARPKVKEDAESGARPKGKGNTDVKPKKGTETDTWPKMKENSGVEIEEITEGGALPKSEESINGDVTPKINKCTENSDCKKNKEKTEDDGIL